MDAGDGHGETSRRRRLARLRGDGGGGAERRPRGSCAASVCVEGDMERTADERVDFLESSRDEDHPCAADPGLGARATELREAC